MGNGIVGLFTSWTLFLSSNQKNNNVENKKIMWNIHILQAKYVQVALELERVSV